MRFGREPHFVSGGDGITYDTILDDEAIEALVATPAGRRIAHVHHRGVAVLYDVDLILNLLALLRIGSRLCCVRLSSSLTVAG